jgi:hypothetical protein
MNIHAHAPSMKIWSHVSSIELLYSLNAPKSCRARRVRRVRRVLAAANTNVAASEPVKRQRRGMRWVVRSPGRSDARICVRPPMRAHARVCFRLRLQRRQRQQQRLLWDMHK